MLENTYIDIYIYLYIFTYYTVDVHYPIYSKIQRKLKR